MCVEGEWGFQFFPIRRESCCGWDYFLNQRKNSNENIKVPAVFSYYHKQNPKYW